MNNYRIGDICEINPKIAIELNPDEQISFVPMNAVSTVGEIDTSKTLSLDSIKNYTIFQEGDILFAKITPCMENGKGCIADKLKNGYGAGSTEFIVLRSKRELVTQKWLYLFLSQKSFRLHCQQHMTGSAGQKRVPPKFLANCDIPCPSLLEQECIVARIEELFSQLDASVVELKTAKERLKVYRQAVLKEAFDQCKEFVPLSSLGDLGRGKSKHRPRNDPALFENGKYPFIQTGDVKAASKYITDYSKMYGPLGLQQSKLWPKGTLCITIAANIAETAFLGIDACFPDSVVGFTPQEKILPEYVRFFIESQKQRLWAFAPATAQKNINLDTLEKLMIPYCPVDKQREIICETDSKITICDNIEQTIATALQQAATLQQSILKKAFEGRL